MPNQQCLLRGIPQRAQTILRDVTILVVIPLDTLLALLSVTFNSVILLAILRRRSVQRPSLLLLCSLSATDEIWAILSVVHNTEFLILGKDLCPKKAAPRKIFAAHLCFFSTIGSLAMISRDRFSAVTNPLRYRSHVTRARAIKQIAMVWVMSVIIAVIASSHNHFPAALSILPYLGIPLSFCYALTIIGCYIGVLIATCRHRASMHLYGGPMRTVLKREKRVANTVGLILLVFGLTLLPTVIAPIALYHFNGLTPLDATPLRPFHSILITLNGLLNPLLNFGRDEDVRRTVRRLTRWQRCCGAVRHCCDVDNGQRRRNLLFFRRNDRVTVGSNQFPHNDRELRMQNSNQSKS